MDVLGASKIGFFFLRIDSRESIRANLRNVGVRIACPLSSELYFLCGPLHSATSSAQLCQEALPKGEVFLLTVGAFLLRVKLLCLQSLKALIRCTFPL